jgi:hypothetical protein
MSRAPDCLCKACESRRAAQTRWLNKGNHRKARARANKKSTAKWKQINGRRKRLEPSDEELDRRALILMGRQV